MIIKYVKVLVLTLTIVCFMCLFSTAQKNDDKPYSKIKVAGAMRNVMQQGQLFGTIYLDSISDKQHLYGLGPVDYLTGELLVIDGRSYRSILDSSNKMKVEETFKTKAAFFVYTNVYAWFEQKLPDSVQTVQQLENYLDKITKTAARPFAFKLTGTVETATIHVVNLPKGTSVNSPADAHIGQENFNLSDEPVEIIGFFSTEHQTIFTHHDSYLHMHLVSGNLKKMGHLDTVIFKKAAVKLYLPLR